MNAYKNLGETDALNSDLIYLFKSSKLIESYEDKNSPDVLYVYDKFLNQASKSKNLTYESQCAQVGFINSLKNNGLNFTLNSVVSNSLIYNKSSQNIDDLLDIQYYTAWKLGVWDELNRVVSLNEHKPSVELSSSFNKSFYDILNITVERQNSCLLIDFNEKVQCLVDNCRNSILDKLIGGNCKTSELTEKQAQLYCLHEVNKFASLLNKNNIGDLNSVFSDSVFSSFELNSFLNNNQQKSGGNKFFVFDDLLSIRLELTKVFVKLKNGSLNEAQKALVAHYTDSLYENLIENTINYKFFQIGLTYVDELRKQTSADSIKLNYIEAQLLYAKAHLKKSKFLLKQSIEEFESKDPSLTNSIDYYLKSIDLYAKLLNETKSENPIVIIRDLLEKSLLYIEKFELDSKPDKLELIFNAFYSLAKFADVQYQNTCEFIKSKSVGEHSELMKQLGEEKERMHLIEPEGQLYRVLNKQHQMDSEEMNVLVDNREGYLCKAIKYYLNCLELGQVANASAVAHQRDDMLQIDNFCIFRLVSLWTQNSLNQVVNKQIEAKIDRISTYKFLPLMHQISARISLKSLNNKSRASTDNSTDELCDERLFQKILINLITNISADHPHHSLPVLFAFKNSNKDYLINDSNASGSTIKSRAAEKDVNNYLMTEDRVSTATHIINTLKNRSPELKTIIESMAILCEAYIELANVPVKDKLKPNESVVFAKNLVINKIKNFHSTSIITNQIPISPTGQYDESKLVYIVKFDPKFKMANGVNMPKIVHCYGSDGVGRKQLVKGRDDLRQDAVMQQFFSTVNDFINFNNSYQNTIKLNKIRTYKIVPLSKKSGVLEWCQNTITMGDWLIGASQDGGAHKKYEPTDLKFDECRRRLVEAYSNMMNAPKASSSRATAASNKKRSRLDTFLEICQNFKPVFRHFFTENYPNTSEWYKRRLNYTRSVATSSIVGYIIGLGDRHVQNILIDTASADVVHIDLGIAFDQGKTLLVPETIPFRLTRDIVDGFGASGIEGVFKNCCEAAMDLLKASKEQIMTIFEVFLYDPLYNWTLTPKKALMAQQTSVLSDSPVFHVAEKNTEKNKIAERILLQINQKLTGYENRTQLSTNGQINSLINEAVSPENLCRVYAGWQPYL